MVGVVRRFCIGGSVYQGATACEGTVGVLCHVRATLSIAEMDRFGKHIEIA
jgi:hypothetical protein